MKNIAETVKPFKATFYNYKKVPNFSKVVCPPYDVISKDGLKKIRKQSRYNFSKILIADKGNYKATRKTLDNWLKDEVLVQDDSESLYLYEQKFKADGKSFIRFGVLALLKMDRKGILPKKRF